MNNNILMLGTFPDPLHGESLCNKILFSYLKKRYNTKALVLNRTREIIETPGKFRLSKFLHVLKIFFVYIRCVAKYDIIYITAGQSKLGLIKSAFFIFIATYIASKKVIVHFHGSLAIATIPSYPKPFAYLLLKLLNKTIVITLSKTVRKMYMDIGLLNTIVVNNFTPDLPGNFQFKSIQRNIGKLKILYLSNLIREKGIFELIDSCKILDKVGIDYELHVAGGGTTDSKNLVLKQLESLNGLSKYHGIVSGQNKSNLLEKCNIFCLPTYYLMEGVPLSILEAMAYGLIIITTNKGGIPDVVTNEINGFLVKPNSTQNLFDLFVKVKELSPDEIESISRNNTKKVKERFSENEFLKNIENILINTSISDIHNNRCD